MNIDPETGIWSLKIAKKRHKIDYDLARIVLDCYKTPKRAVDIGCGAGHYCSFFSSGGWNIVGIEGTIGIKILGVYNLIIESDLTKAIEVEGDLIKSTKFASHFDFSLCLEVGEHIPKKHEGQFVDNVCMLSGKDIVLSWAVPGQYSASGHVNCQPNEYVIERFKERGFLQDRFKTKIIRKYAKFNWFKNTVMCFEKEGCC
jgi:SAM-dependent methyltransferase